MRLVEAPVIGPLVICGIVVKDGFIPELTP